MNQKQFATDVTRRLQDAGHTTFWAGGCVRDALLGHSPKDYDVATSATPDQVRELFGFRKTIPVGASFGVITVVGPKTAGVIEVATFRKDGGYSDGRRPDAVQFTDAREDARRRDFTINGMFFDPVTDRVIDFVEGQQDLRAKVIRAIGDADARIAEDKLRMMRAVRFAATLRFEIEPATLKAVRANAATIDVVSPERIGAEMKRMLSGEHFLRAVQLLQQADLLDRVTPVHLQDPESRLRALRLSDGNLFRFESVVALLFLHSLDANASTPQRASFLEELKGRWRLTNEQTAAIGWVGKHCWQLSGASRKPWSAVQPILSHRLAWAALDVADATGLSQQDHGFCEGKLSLPPKELDPPPLVVGKDLINAGMKPGRSFSRILQTIRDRQLDGELNSRESAIEAARRL